MLEEDVHPGHRAAAGPGAVPGPAAGTPGRCGAGLGPRRGGSRGQLRGGVVDRAGRVDAAVVELPEVDTLRVRHLGVDKHRFARARFFRDDTGGWQRVEPWMSTFVNTDTGQVLGIVDGRNSTGIQGWLDARTLAWRNRIEIVAINPSATFRSALETALPAARISVDH